MKVFSKKENLIFMCRKEPKKKPFLFSFLLAKNFFIKLDQGTSCAEATLGSGVLGPSCSELDVGPLRLPSRCHNNESNFNNQIKPFFQNKIKINPTANTKKKS